MTTAIRPAIYPARWNTIIRIGAWPVWPSGWGKRATGLILTSVPCRMQLSSILNRDGSVRVMRKAFFLLCLKKDVCKRAMAAWNPILTSKDVRATRCRGMIRLMGGDKSFVSKLDSLFTMHLPAEFFAQTEDVTEEGLLGGYVHGNEPSHHIPFLYAWTSQPWKTQYWQREIMNKMYRNNIDGLCGNDDCGQMSAWYIFSAMGFYPVNPISGEYVLGAPQIEKISLSLPEGKTFTVEAKGLSKTNKYVKSVELNGKPVTGLTISHKDVMNGGNLVFTMTDQPGR